MKNPLNGFFLQAPLSDQTASDVADGGVHRQATSVFNATNRRQQAIGGQK